MSMHIVLDSVSKTIKEQIILNSITASFEKGRTYGIIGRNGSGKSMMLRTICGFVKPDSGTVEVNGKVLCEKQPFAENVGFLFNSPAFVEDIDGFTNLKLLAAIRSKIDEKTVREWMERVGLDPKDRKPVSKYSTGMRQRLGIAQALMENPSLIILDEPMNGIDKAGFEDILKLLQAEKQKGKTILLTSHLDEDIDTLCDEIYKIDGGCLYKPTE